MCCAILLNCSWHRPAAPLRSQHCSPSPRLSGQPRTRPPPFFRRDDAVDNLNAPAARAALRIRAAEAPRLDRADRGAVPGADSGVPKGIAAAALPRGFHAVSTRSTVPFRARSGTQPLPFARYNIATPPLRPPPLPSGENGVAELRSPRALTVMRDATSTTLFGSHESPVRTLLTSPVARTETGFFATTRYCH